jgi:hypothetical protein
MMHGNRPPRSEAFWLALVIAAILLALLMVLTVIAWRSPFVLFRLPERTTSALSAQPSPIL